MATSVHDLTRNQHRQASRLLDALNPAAIVEDAVWDVCLEVAAALPDGPMDRLVQAAELAQTRRERYRQLVDERFRTVTRG